MDKEITKEIIDVSLSMFRKNFIGIYHGSISARSDYNKFIINTKDAIFDELTHEDLVELYTKKDYRWNEASLDSNIHLAIYNNISEARYICYTMPHYATALSLKSERIEFKDYFGNQHIGELEVYDPKNYDDWYDRADVEIVNFFKKSKNSLVLIKGYGIYSYDRDIHNMAKKIAIVENSCRILML